MKEEPYKVIYTNGIAIVEEKKSKFIAITKPILAQEDADAILSEIKKEYWDARHHCYAYVLGDRNETAKCSDDGEPSQTAGKPILDVLYNAQIHNAMIVVVRYFGGTLLGTGGLVRAYQKAASEGLSKSTILELHRGRKANIDIDYTALGKIQYILSQNNCIILDTVYEGEVQLKILIPEDMVKITEKKILDQTGGKSHISWDENVRYGYFEKKIKIF